MTELHVLKNFTYSTDGVTSHEAKVDEVPNPAIPEDLLPGLLKERYISLDGEKKAPGAPENKMNSGSQENKGGAGGDNNSGVYTAKHVGRGSWFIFKGDEKLPLKLTKADAKAFNKLPPEKQAEFVEAQLANE
ncbi:hypothetical protein MXMO3_01812 [Maritalea myrionectae]|uniref:Uncharacterized protein n=1 Tax=Maritalea myrionectae TaxID=454601 RepID=A0A2R4ME73_9HYPH|nr:hypothetical protein [Maritalea myrionectae]AVX04337.1 hypothetical protein MXMO3_01812 [Maritalea myrionectae]